MKKCAVLIVAAGRGARFGGEIPKQWRLLDQRPILRHSLALFAAHPLTDEIRVVIHPNDLQLYEEAARGFSLPAPIFGGATRQESVRLGLEALSQDAPDLVLIHDGARPFVDSGLVGRVVEALEDRLAAIPALAITDSLKRSAPTSRRIEASVPRDNLWAAQTPQGFDFQSILSAHRNAAGRDMTDDAQLAELAGMDVFLVDGSKSNVKITTQADLDAAQSRFGERTETRTGNGFDVHRFDAGDHVVLCNVKLPHDRGLLGHSDADAALHAVTDALLGAIGAGDIGRHFPPSDPKWKGASSDLFLKYALALLDAKGGRIVNVDLTIICERPKIGPYRQKMRKRLAEILETEEDRVNVKATTTEELGFAGRREGIAASASCSVSLPIIL